MRWIIAILVAVHCAASAESNSKMGQIYHKVRELFEAGKCDQVIAIAGSANDSEQVDDLNALASSELFVARCYFQRDDISIAESRLRNILFLKPDFELDAFETPPTFFTVFEKVKNELAQKTKELNLVKETAKQKSDILETEVVVRKMSPFAPLVPFGFAQFEYGAKIKGILIAVLEGSFLLANVGSYWAKRSIASSEAANLVSDQGALSNYNMAQGFQFASLGFFAAIYLFGAIDGFVHKDDLSFESSRTQSRRLSRDEFLQRLNELKNKGS